VAQRVEARPEQFMGEELPRIFERADRVDLIPPRVKEVVIAPVHHAYAQLAPS
jgi:hypothetical protein